MLKKITAILCLVIGIIVVILGVTIDASKPNHAPEDKSFRYTASGYDVSSAAFGADFYTYTYRGIDTAVAALDGIDKSTETVVKAQNGIYQATVANIAAVDSLAANVSKIGKLIVLSIGLMVTAFGLYACGNVFVVASPTVSDMPQSTDEKPVEAESLSEEQTAEDPAEE